ncbi:Crp/Fnr family transcriptional regulator [Rapidithrix thailandica]|uniref:Crp/Fnr family transcriptional regulator n=1 Tax=Rapidithrix thailandica TaxID=413964 RepID=A0AAW9RXN8_9BACT
MENSLQRLKQSLFQITKVENPQWLEFAQQWEQRSFSKQEILTSFDQVENYLYFISKGLVRVYYLLEGKEHGLDFCFENEFVTSYSSFLTRRPSRVQITTILPTEVLRIHYQQIHKMYDQSKTSERIGRRIAEAMYVRKTQREIELLSLSADQRYQNLLNKNPRLVQAIPIKYLASYLGILPESLSRIRRKLRNKEA